MKYNSLEPFVPSGPDFTASRSLFIDLGFEIDWEAEGLVGFTNGSAKFILQNYDHNVMAENLMIKVIVEDLDAFWEEIQKADLDSKYGIKLNGPKDFPWGRELHLIDLAGVCWHFAVD